MSFGGLDFSAPFHLLTAPKKWIFDRFFLFFESFPRITPLQIERGSKIKYVHLVGVLDVLFRWSQLFSLIEPLLPT